MVKTFYKTIYRMFKNNKGRFLANLLIVLISVAISAGLASLPSIYENSFSMNYSTGNAPDIILKETTGKGFSDEDENCVKEDADVEDVYSFTCMDLISEEHIYRFYIYDFDSKIARLNLLSGEYPDEPYSLDKDIAVVAQKGGKAFASYSIGDEIVLKTPSLKIFGYESIRFKVNGIVDSPLYNSVQKENANLQGSSQEVLEKTYIDAVFYLDKKLVPDEFVISNMSISTSSLLVKTDMYVTYKNKSAYYSSAYEKEMDLKKEDLQKKIKNSYALTLQENVSYAMFKGYNDKVRYISYVFPVFFVLVCALVNLITITKLIKDERPLIATYVSLGVAKGKIVFKYFLFTLLSTVIGSILGILCGISLLPNVVLPAFDSVFEMFPISLFSKVDWYGYFCCGVILLTALSVTLGSAVSYLKEMPASLMKQKSPKPGKKILLQHIAPLWNLLPFRYKSSLRNIFLQKKNLILTSLSIIGSTLLIFAGFALLDASNALIDDPIFGNVSSSMGLISLVIILFALAMGVVVIYSLAIMNVSDREREIATLKVLGYHDRECLAYTFREIMSISLFSCLFGLPISALIIDFVVFRYLGFGTLEDVGWYSYLFTFLLIFVMTMAINLLLYPKIKKIDMNLSLKTLD